MKSFVLIGIITLFTACISIPVIAVKKPINSPLYEFSDAWKDPKYDAANSARNATYMSETEREVIHILNLVRMDPVLFESTVVSQYPRFSDNPKLSNNSYYKSLTATMKKLKPLKILLPNKFCFESAQCHAQTSGNAAYVGHDRLTADCKKASFYFGECISYGYDNALDIVMALLIDEDVPSLAHRKNFLGDFRSVAVSIQPHKSYRYNTVIDLAY